MSDELRREFEQWARENNYPTARYPESVPRDYVMNSTSGAWGGGYQAGHAAATERAAAIERRTLLAHQKPQ